MSVRLFKETSGETDVVNLYVSSYTGTESRSATVTFKEVGGDLVTSVTINQITFEGFNGYVSSNTVYANYKADGYQPLGMGNL